MESHADNKSYSYRGAKMIKIGTVEEIFSNGVTKLERVIANTQIATKLNEICLVGLSEFIYLLFTIHHSLPTM